MRLLDVHTLEFQEVLDHESETYAILSHTWDGGQEVSYQDWHLWLKKHPGWEEVQERSGYAKIVGACAKARANNYNYIWYAIDRPQFSVSRPGIGRISAATEILAKSFLIPMRFALKASSAAAMMNSRTTKTTDRAVSQDRHQLYRQV